MRRGLLAVLAVVVGAVIVGVVSVAMVGHHRAGPDDDAGTSAAGTFEDTLQIDGQRRTFRVYVPPRAAGRTDRPVVVALHGAGGNGEQFERQSRLNPVADRAGFVVVYPDGSGRTRLLTWNAGTCCGYARDRDVDDVAFLARLLDELPSRYRTDPSRVYVTGLSNGAMMTYRLGCELADRVTAIAAVAGALNVDGCAPARPLPVLVVHGSADTMVPYSGGPPIRSIPGAGTWQNRSVPDSVAVWTRVDRCRPTPTESSEGNVRRTSYAPCEQNTEVIVYTVEGGGHAWPGGAKPREAADDPPPSPDTSNVIWDFFARFPVR